MPQNAAEKGSNDEGRIQLAINFNKRAKLLVCAKAARGFGVLRLTLLRLVAGSLASSRKHRLNTKLSQIEEIALYNWIISMDKRSCSIWHL
jgi:hypothetical protein